MKIRPKLNINFEEIKATIEDKRSIYYYQKLLARYRIFTKSFRIEDWALIYYGFSFQEDYLKNSLDESELNNLLEAHEYEKLVSECNQILLTNPVSLMANLYMSLALRQMGNWEYVWKAYQDRYCMFRKVISCSGDGLSPETAFKVIYVSDEYDMMREYYRIPHIKKQMFIDGSYDKFLIEPSARFNSEEIYFDISQNIKRVEQLSTSIKSDPKNFEI